MSFFRRTPPRLWLNAKRVNGAMSASLCAFERLEIKRRWMDPMKSFWAKIRLLKLFISMFEEWIHLLMEYQIPMEFCFPPILSKTDFHKVYGNILWKLTSTKFVENGISSLLWKIFYGILVPWCFWKM